MLLQDINERYDIIFPFLIELYSLFHKQDYEQDADTCQDWEYFVYSYFNTILDNHFSKDGLIVEDFNPKKSENTYTWLCDPVDGTSNMSTGVSFFSCVFSLVKDKTQPVLSFILDMIKGQIYISHYLNNECYSINTKEYSSYLDKSYGMSNSQYVLIGKIFGHTNPKNLAVIQKDWWDLAINSNSYRQLGSVALQMILDGYKRNAIVFSLEIRWFDVVASLHFLNNLGYNYYVSENRECLIVYKPETQDIPALSKIIQTIQKKWKFLPLNTIDIDR